MRRKILKNVPNYGVHGISIFQAVTLNAGTNINSNGANLKSRSTLGPSLSIATAIKGMLGQRTDKDSDVNRWVHSWIYTCTLV
jgi:hypothetical protein